MEAFVVAIVFVTAWVAGAESRLVDPKRHVESEVISTSDEVGAQEPAVHICGPGHHQIIQRDLTVRVDQQVNEDVR
ncbi:MAG: hypothetical protein Cons2KO_33350 [Congregibacter sp.]